MHCFVKFAVLVFLFGCSSSKKEVVKRLPPLCPSKAMQGYEGPCEVYGTMGAANRYFYTSTRRHFLDRTYKKWDLETGQVVADNLSHRETLGIPKELQRYTYPQEGELIVLAEARDIPIAVIAGEFAGEKSELMVVDLSKKKIIHIWWSTFPPMILLSVICLVVAIFDPKY